MPLEFLLHGQLSLKYSMLAVRILLTHVVDRVNPRLFLTSYLPFLTLRARLNWKKGVTAGEARRERPTDRETDPWVVRIRHYDRSLLITLASHLGVNVVSFPLVPRSFRLRVGSLVILFTIPPLRLRFTSV